MLSYKVFSRSAAYSKTPFFGEADRVCRFCKKTFCCTKCHVRHVNKVHPNVNADCPLCASEVLSMRPYVSAKLNFEDDKLLCHIVDKHLPLHCQLCGDLFESIEDFRTVATCKWFERWHCLTSPICYEHPEKKPCSISGNSDCNSSRFWTPPEIYRKTSTPMFVGQKIGCETPCVPEFSLKTPKNSPSITHIASISSTSDTQFFSFTQTSSEGMTPFRSYKNEFSRNNSGKKLSIMEEDEKIRNEEAEKITAHELLSPVNIKLTSESSILTIPKDSPKSDDVTAIPINLSSPVNMELSEASPLKSGDVTADSLELSSPVDMELTLSKGSPMTHEVSPPKLDDVTANSFELSSPVDMELTLPMNSILTTPPENSSLKSNNIREDVVKKVRFSDQYKTAGELENLESCVQAIINLSMEEVLHDDHDETNAQKTKATAEDTPDARDIMDTGNPKDMCVVENAKNTNDNQAEDEMPSLIKSSKDFLSDSQSRTVQDNAKKENRDPEVSHEGASTVIQRDSNRVLMMVLLENNSSEFTNDLMPLISSGLKKLEEQLKSTNFQPPSKSTESAKICRRSITTMRMRVSSVERYSASNEETTNPNHRELASSSSSSFVQSNKNNNNGGFLSTVSQTIKYAFRNLSGLRMPLRNMEAIEITEQRESNTELTSSQGTSSDSSSRIRPSKRVHEVTEESSSESNSILSAFDIKSPLAKRSRRGYRMIRGRQPIHRMRNSHVTTSSRGVSAGTQVFSQGSLTVGDTILPLPARAHQ
ncbi:PREDICTED: uncharacterized protein LOC105568881 [Vollenhovia emeryi]|uniref:uncharacterized protein LOC105568881 n=1 Tax=Vollenhovia emeryi TaxID=411798 RepID=UPI0005F41930|nr:PREDICTED: uncharacterized protein LOC105568881 [Vollenhovia emeryi]